MLPLLGMTQVTPALNVPGSSRIVRWRSGWSSLSGAYRSDWCWLTFYGWFDFLNTFVNTRFGKRQIDNVRYVDLECVIR